jgi:hypothetical protein
MKLTLVLSFFALVGVPVLANPFAPDLLGKRTVCGGNELGVKEGSGCEALPPGDMACSANCYDVVRTTLLYLE